MNEGLNNGNIPKNSSPEKPRIRRSEELVTEATPPLDDESDPSAIIEARRRALRAMSIKKALESRIGRDNHKNATDIDFSETIPDQPDDSGFSNTIPSEFPTLTTVVENPSQTIDDSRVARESFRKNKKKGFFRSLWNGLSGGTRWIGKQLARYQDFTEEELLTLNKARYGNRGQDYGNYYQKAITPKQLTSTEISHPTLPEPVRMDVTPTISNVVLEEDTEPHTHISPQPALEYSGTKDGRAPVWEEPQHESTFDDPRKFLESLYPSHNESSDTTHVEKIEKVVPQISYNEALAKIDSIERKAKNIRSTLIEKLGVNGKELLALADRGAKFFKENVSWKTRAFAGAGLLTSAALSVYAAPIVLTALGVTSLSMRVISASSTYLVLKKVLDKNFEEREKRGDAASERKKVCYGVGAMLIAGLTGQAVGHLVENGIPQSIREMFQSPVPSPVDTQEIPSSPAPTVAPQIEIESPAETVNTPLEVVHSVGKGDTLWSILRLNLLQENFENFKDLNFGEREKMIQIAVNKMSENPELYGIESGNIHKLNIGDEIKISLSELFKK